MADLNWRRVVVIGLGLGWLIAACEALKNIPPSLLIHYRQPIDISLISVIFDLALGVISAIVSTWLLRTLGRAESWTTLSFVAALLSSVFILCLPPEVPAFIDMERGLAVFWIVSFPLLTRFAGRGRALRLMLALGGVAIIVGYGLSYVRPTVSWQLEHLRSQAPPSAANVLLIVLDTVRADRLQLYGYDRPTFPQLSQIASEGAMFERAISAAPWTLPSHASMFTGLYPSSHGAGHERAKLDADQETLAEILRRAGWHTLALSSNPWLSRSSGVTQGFAHQPPTWLAFPARGASFAYRVAWQLGWIVRDHGGDAVRRAWFDWLDRWDGERPFFAFLNFVEPHIPLHDLPEPYLRMFTPEGLSFSDLKKSSDAVHEAERHGRVALPGDAQRANQLYDGGVRYNGDLSFDVIESLRRRGALDNTVVILVADHGDMNGEHDMFNHTRSLTDYLLRVPLVIRFPPKVQAGLRIATPVSTAALMPTILDLVGVLKPEGVPTQSFASLLDGVELDTGLARSPLLSEVSKDLGQIVAPDFQPRNDFDRLGVRYRSLEEDGFKLIVDSEGNQWLFRPQDDATESKDLSADYPERVESLKETLSTLEQAYGLGAIDRETLEPLDPSELDPEVRERLKSLGYLG